jgi:hypothetical protein
MNTIQLPVIHTVEDPILFRLQLSELLAAYQHSASEARQAKSTPPEYLAIFESGIRVVERVLQALDSHLASLNTMTEEVPSISAKDLAAFAKSINGHVMVNGKANFTMVIRDNNLSLES